MQLKRVNVLNGQVNTVLHKVNKLSEQMTPFTDMLKDIQEGLKQQRNVADATAGKLEQVEGKMAKIEQIIAVALGKVFAKVDSKTATGTKRSLPPLESMVESSDYPEPEALQARTNWSKDKHQVLKVREIIKEELVGAAKKLRVCNKIYDLHFGEKRRREFDEVIVDGAKIISSMTRFWSKEQGYTAPPPKCTTMCLLALNRLEASNFIRLKTVEEPKPKKPKVKKEKVDKKIDKNHW